MKTFTAAQMKEIDRIAIEERGIGSDVLMERAARALTAAILELPAQERSAVVFCGSGNNGGDGVAAARFLLQAGWRVRCLLVGRREKMTGDCREMERRLAAAGGVLEDFVPGEDCGGYAVAVDALFGIGLRSPLRPDALAAVEEMDKARWRVSADIPSGIHADTGAALGRAVRADVTVTFSALKPGLVTGDGGACAGKVVVADIGIPPELLV